MGTPQIWDGHEGSVSPGAQIPAGTCPPPCQHPQSGLAQLSLLQCHSQSQFKPARPQSIPAQAAVGAQLQSPHARMHRHLQISPVICLVNSFSLEGQRMAAKHYQPNQTIPNPETSRGLPGLQTTPNSIPAHRGRRCKAQLCRHPPAPQGQVTSSLSLLPVATQVQPCCSPHTNGLSPEPALWVYQSKDPQTGPPCTPRLVWVKPSWGSPSHSPTCLQPAETHCPGSRALPQPSPFWGCFLDTPRPTRLQFPVLFMQGQRWCAVGCSLPEIPALPSAPQGQRHMQPCLGDSLGGCLIPSAPWSPVTEPPRWTLT